MSMAFPTQCWRGLPFPAPGGLPDLGIKAVSPASLALAGRFLTSAPPGKPSLQSTSFKIEYFHLLLHFKISLCILNTNPLPGLMICRYFLPGEGVSCSPWDYNLT